MSEFSEGLRQMADWLDSHPEFAEEWSYSTFNFYATCYTKEDFSKFAQNLGGSEKFDSYGYIGLIKAFGPHELRLQVGKEISCERVEVGTETITRQVLSDAIPEGAKLLLDHVLVEVEVPKYKWECPPSLLAMGQDSE
jgi:hypothetical protein